MRNAPSVLRARNNDAGFTLVEVIITVFILGVISVMFASMITTFSLTRNAAHDDVALRIAADKMSELRTLGYGALPSTGPFNDGQLSNLPSGAASTTVSTLNAATKQVVVTVSWQDPGKQRRYVSISTYITQTGGL